MTPPAAFVHNDASAWDKHRCVPTDVLHRQWLHSSLKHARSIHCIAVLSRHNSSRYRPCRGELGEWRVGIHACLCGVRDSLETLRTGRVNYKRKAYNNVRD